MKALGIAAVFALIALAGALLAPNSGAVAADGRGQASLAPEECTCSAGIDLAAPGAPPSTLRNCRCGSLQCVVHVQSGQLQCS